MTQRPFSWMNPKLEMRAQSLADCGVFARASLRAGERLIVSGGRVLTLEQEGMLPASIIDYAHQIDDDLVIGIAHPDEAEDCARLNHSCDPNAGFDGQIELVAMRDIAADQEITFDYAIVLCNDTAPVPYRLECLCGSPRCRKAVTGDDRKRPELQARYEGYFQPYLQKKIGRLKGVSR